MNIGELPHPVMLTPVLGCDGNFFRQEGTFIQQAPFHNRWMVIDRAKNVVTEESDPMMRKLVRASVTLNPNSVDYLVLSRKITVEGNNPASDYFLGIPDTLDGHLRFFANFRDKKVLVAHMGERSANWLKDVLEKDYILARKIARA